MRKIFTLLLLFFISIGYSQTSTVSIGNRESFTSKVLNEDRSYQIYLPATYNNHPKAVYPVLYVLDGDYNFHYDSGVVEFLSNTAFTIPEMIVVGISDKGGTKQRANSDPKQNADNFIQFISKELKPLINSKYRTSGLDILAGHSKFGIFATHYWMKNTNDFDIYLAIDPSYWFNDFEINKRLETDLSNGFKTNSKLIIAQAIKDVMGIEDFVKILNKNLPNSDLWELKEYLNDSHGSLHLKAITDALNDAFKGWEITRETFYKFKNGSDIVSHYKTLKDKYNSEFLLPWYTFSNILYSYVNKNKTEDIQLLKDGLQQHFPNSLSIFNIQLANNYIEAKKYDDAKALYNACLAENKNDYKALEGLAKVALAKNDKTTAKAYLDQAIKLAKQANERQWYLNEITSQFDKL